MTKQVDPNKVGELRYIKLLCKKGGHLWMPTTSDKYEMCQYCKVTRKKEGKKEQHGSTTETTN